MEIHLSHYIIAKSLRPQAAIGQSEPLLQGHQPLTTEALRQACASGSVARRTASVCPHSRSSSQIFTEKKGHLCVNFSPSQSV